MSEALNGISNPPDLLGVQCDGFGGFVEAGALRALRAVWPELDYGSAEVWLTDACEVDIESVSAVTSGDDDGNSSDYFDQVAGLVQVAKEHGRLPYPILVKRTPKGHYRVIAGRKLLSAAKIARLGKVDVNVVGSNEANPRDCIQKGATYQRELVVGSDSDDWSAGLCLIPALTPWGTFVVRGKEYVLVTELVRGPGIYFKFDGDGKFRNARIVPDKKGTCDFLPEIKIERSDGKIIASASTVLDKEPIGGLIERLDEASSKQERKDGGASADNRGEEKKAISDFLRNYPLGKAGRRSLKARVGSAAEGDTLQGEDLLRIKELIDSIPDKGLHALPEEDAGKRLVLTDNDSLEWKQAKRSGDFLEDALAKSLAGIRKSIERNLNESSDSASGKKGLIDLRDIAEAIHDRYNGRLSRSVCSQFANNSLLQLLDQENPLSEMEQKRRISLIGPGGLSADRISDNVRTVHRSHYGRICPVETPEGQKVGVTLSLAHRARVSNEQIEAPYCKWGAEEVEWLSAAKETEPAPEQPGQPRKFVPCTKRGDSALGEKPGSGLCRKEGDFYGVQEDDGSIAESYVDAYRDQMFSVATSLIPYVEHDDAHRALMGSNMQRQAIPLCNPQAPLVQTGTEAEVAKRSRVIPVAKAAGTVKYSDSEEIRVEREGGEVDAYRLDVFERTNKGGSRTLRPLVRIGERVKSNQVLADGYATQKGRLALGANLLAAYMCWEGYNYEDGIVLSQRVLDEDLLTSVHIDEHRVEIKKGEVERTKRRVRVGQAIQPGSILVEKRIPGPARPGTDAFLSILRYVEDEMQIPSGKYLEKLSGKPTTVRAPEGFEGTVVSVESDKKNGCKLPSGVADIITVRVARERKVEIGDKLAGRHGNKGVVCKILPVHEMPFLADGTPVDIILNPLGVPSRLNVGQLFECATGWGAKWGCGTEKDSEPGTASEPACAKCPPFDGLSGEALGRLLEEANGKIAQLRSDERFQPLMEGGKVALYDGETGKPFDGRIAVGYAYMMKLDHMVQDKMHARATGPYSIIEDQPQKGRNRGGGQKIGDMETWAIGAHGANVLLKEMFTGHSDQVSARKKLGSSSNKESESEPSHSDLPETTKVFLMYLRALCLNWGEDAQKLLGEGEGFSLEFADEDAVKNWSRGEVKKAALWDFRTNKKEPEPMEAGLLDKDIFGKEKSKDGGWKSNFGHIELNSPVVHPWFGEEDQEGKWDIKRLPVLPAGLRPVMEMPDGRYSTSDLNVLYANVINWNNVLGDLHKLKEKAGKVPGSVVDALVDEARRRLQLSIDQLMVNGELSEYDKDLRVRKQRQDKKGRAYKSLTDFISGKQGIIRKSLLAKRVDFSGRSVIATDPELSFDQCSLPYEMAAELFRPQLVEAWGSSGKTTESLIRENWEESRKKLEDIFKSNDCYVLLNRTPTLHRPSIQAFKPVLAVKGRKAIGLHPMACSAFNADFDGDTMAVFVPMEKESRREARTMLASNNILSPATGNPLATPTQDMVIGIYWKTRDKVGKEELYENIKSVASRDFDEETLAGFPELSSWMRKGDIEKYVAKVCEFYRRHGKAVSEAAPVLNELMRLGFAYAKESCLTVSYADLFSNDIGSKEKLREKLDALGDDRMTAYPILAMTNSGARGKFDHARQILVSRGKMKGSEGETMEVPISHSLAEGMDPLEYWLSVYGSRKDVMNTALGTAKSGTFARSLVNAVQDVRITGPDCKTDKGRKVHLSPAPWLIGCVHIVDSRTKEFETIEDLKKIDELYDKNQGGKHEVDLLLKLEDDFDADGCGWAVNRCDLIDGDESTPIESVAQIKALHDEGCRELAMRAELKFDSSDYAWMVGRYRVSGNGSELIETVKQVDDLFANGPREIALRSPMYCESEDGICQHCYGWDLTSRRDAEIGAAVGIVAAQSMSEPTTQMTLSTFHGGGTAGDDITKGLPYIKDLLNHPNSMVGENLSRAKEHMAEMVKDAYSSQGAEVDDRHIELVIGQLVKSENAKGEIEVYKKYEVCGDIKEPGFKLVPDTVIAELKASSDTAILERDETEGGRQRVAIKGPKVYSQRISNYKKLDDEEESSKEKDSTKTVKKGAPLAQMVYKADFEGEVDRVWRREIIVVNGKERQLPEGAKLSIKRGEKIKKGNVIGGLPVLSKASGKVKAIYSKEVASTKRWCIELDGEFEQIRRISLPEGATLRVARGTDIANKETVLWKNAEGKERKAAFKGDGKVIDLEHPENGSTVIVCQIQETSKTILLSEGCKKPSLKLGSEIKEGEAMTMRSLKANSGGDVDEIYHRWVIAMKDGSQHALPMSFRKPTVKKGDTIGKSLEIASRIVKAKYTGEVKSDKPDKKDPTAHIIEIEVQGAGRKYVSSREAGTTCLNPALEELEEGEAIKAGTVLFYQHARVFGTVTSADSSQSSENAAGKGADGGERDDAIAGKGNLTEPDEPKDEAGDAGSVVEYKGAAGYESLAANPASGSFLAAAAVEAAKSVLVDAVKARSVDHLSGFKERLIFGLPVYEANGVQDSCKEDR